VVQRIEFVGLSPELQQRVQNRLTVREGDTLDRGGLGRAQDEVRQIDEHLIVVMQSDAIYDPQRSKVVLRIMLRPDGTAPANGTYRIGGGVSAPVVILKPNPEYTDEARKAKWQGAVLLSVVIDEDGVPQEIKVVRSLGLGLDEKATEAVQQWRFKPGLKDGKPVPVSAVIEVPFRLL